MRKLLTAIGTVLIIVAMSGVSASAETEPVSVTYVNATTNQGIVVTYQVQSSPVMADAMVETFTAAYLEELTGGVIFRSERVPYDLLETLGARSATIHEGMVEGVDALFIVASEGSTTWVFAFLNLNGEYAATYTMATLSSGVPEAPFGFRRLYEGGSL